MAPDEPIAIDIPVRIASRARTFPSALVAVMDALSLAAGIIVAEAPSSAVVAAFVVFVALTADTSRAYRLDPTVGREMGWVLGRIGVPLLAIASAGALGIVPGLAADSGLTGLLAFGGVGTALVLAGRAVAYAIQRAAALRGVLSERTVVVGAGALGLEIAATLDRYPRYGLQVVGFVDRDPPHALPYPLLGEPGEMAQVVSSYGVRRVIVAFGSAADSELAAVLRALENLPVEVHIVPRFFELGTIPGHAVDDVRGIPLLHLRRPGARVFARLSKRAFDVTVALALLIATLPLVLAAAVAIRLTAPGPVLFRQTRIGRRGRHFEILKFRTMHPNAGSDTAWSPESHQLTGIGRLLRRTSVDELPQLINVIRGDMSLVGPRPERPFFAAQFSAETRGYADRLRMAGGITGLAQVYGRSRRMEGISERARLDNAYIDGWSLWTDILIMCRTVGMLFRGDAEDGAEAEGASRASAAVIRLLAEERVEEIELESRG